MYLKDQYGWCRPGTNPHSGDDAWDERATIEATMDKQQSYYQAGAEMSCRRGVDRKKILRIACQSEDARSSLISRAKKAGVMQVNGVPIEDFVVVANKMGDVYKHYVKPLGY
jgi:hypothetical protein